MADIKAKDISVAQSVGASDLILGSSIAGTTANVRVDTLGNYLINTQTYSSLNNQSVSAFANSILNVTNRLTTKRVITYQSNSQSTDYFYTGKSIIVPANKTYLIQARTAWSYTRSDGLILSSSSEMLVRIAVTEGENSNNTPIVLITGERPLYLWAKRDIKSSLPDNYFIEYIEIQ